MAAGELPGRRPRSPFVRCWDRRHLLARAVKRVHAVLPRGGSLPEEAWRRRHRGILVLLWFHVPAVVVFALSRGESLAHASLEAAAVVAFAAPATLLRHVPRTTTILAAIGLLTSSAVLVHLSGGVIEVHFHFFVMVGVIVLYQDWWPFLVAIGYVVLQHGIAGALAPEEVYNHPAAVANPWTWAGIHGLFIVGMSAAGIAAWRLNEALHEASLERERQLAQAQEVAHLGSWAWDVVNDRAEWSDEQYRLFGLRRDEFEPTYETFLERVHIADRELADGTIRSALATSSGFAFDFRAVLPDGRVRWLHARGDVVATSAGTPARMCGTVLDVTERKQSEDALRASEERYRRIVETAREGVWILDTDHRTTFVNSRLAEMLGYTIDEMVGVPLVDFVDGGARDGVRAALTSTRAGGDEHHDFRFRRKDGTELWAMLSTSHLLDQERTATGTLAMVSDITVRKQVEQRLAHQALHDPLTGLPNRLLLLDRLEQAMARARRSGGWTGVLFFDLDRFKVVNDGLGHGSGDELLMAVASRLVSSARPMDTVARFGGDEFVVLCEDMPDEATAAVVADRIGAAVRHPVRLGDRDVTVTVSIGIATDRAGAADPEGLLRDADAAMYEAKLRGRGRHEVFDTTMRTRVVERLETEAALRRALEHQEFRLVYQPEVSLRDGAAVGVEALLRWEHPERGLLSPASFMPLAEETGLIVPIGAWVLDEACRQLQEWRQAHTGLCDLIVWVNLSARQLAERDLTDVVARALANSGLEPANLGLEITESAVMEDLDATGHALIRLKTLGVGLALDDFGTGFSSMNYLKQFPVNLLKVDRSFVAGLGSNTGDSAIVAAVIGLAQSLGLATVAEGVETFEQLSALHTLGCSFAQGYFFGRPRPPADVERSLTAIAEVAAAPFGKLDNGGVGRSPRPPVLVCDDNAVTRRMYREAFEAVGATVEEAADGNECLRVADRHRPRLVLLDAVMPNGDGFSVLPDLRQLLPDARVVMVTAFDAGDIAARSHHLGADACIEKVSLLTRLDHAVAEYLDLPTPPTVHQS